MKYSELEASIIDYKGEIREQEEMFKHQLISVEVTDSGLVLKG